MPKGQSQYRLVEIKDKKFLARIDSAVPGTLQVVANTEAVKAYREASKSAGQLCQAIISQGAVLDKSRAMEDAELRALKKRIRDLEEENEFLVYSRKSTRQGI